ncbi:MAG: hypothetical protein K2O67_03585 [Clostridia bacterium]|nr:hypothetical protein [Clostridia bacterium]
MPEERKKIIIGGEYAQAYADVVKILASGCLTDAAAHLEKDKDGREIICTDAEEFVYGGGSGVSSGGNVSVSIKRDGASWFAPVRCGKAFDDGTSEWRQLIYKVARNFHDRFSIIEYKRCDASGSLDGVQAEENVRKVISRFFSRKDVNVIKGNDRNKGTEDIYGASVKLELSGTGQSHYVVMCKIYFRRTSFGVAPISGAEAEIINAKLEQAPDNDDPVRLTAEESAEINNITVNAVRDLVEGRYAVSFKESLCFSRRKVLNPESKKYEDNYDLKTYNALAERAARNQAPVTCTSIQVLGISHVEWVNDYYEVAFGGKVYLQVIVGFGGAITLRCNNCGGANLVTSNVITYKVTDDDGLTKTVNVTLDYSQPDLGISNEALAEIKKYSEFANHLLEVKCGHNRRTGKACVSCLCRSQMIVIDGVAKCADCPYPEVVYTDYSGEAPMRYLTGRMTFVNDRLGMVLSERAAACSRCGRSFTKEALNGGECKLCSGIGSLEGEVELRARKLYKRYKNAFSPAVRLKHAFDKKYCLEDDTALVFAMGSETYVLSKLELKDTGFVKEPVKIK